MQTNQYGIPLWAIRRLLICRANLIGGGYKNFEIAKDGSILLNGQYESHVDLVYYNENTQDYCIPMAS